MGATLPGRRVPPAGALAPNELPLERRSVERASLSDALKSWFAGDFELCLEQCAVARPPDSDSAIQIGLLQARALLRLSRPAEASAILEVTPAATHTIDSAVTAEMLLGAAKIRLDEPDIGRAILQRARARADSAHPTIRSEIALYLALAHYRDRNLTAAEAELDNVSPNADIIHARALEYRGWIAIARADYHLAATQFKAAISRLDECGQRDRFLEANSLQALSFFAAETADVQLWTYLQDRYDHIDWTPSGLTVGRFWIALNNAIMHESQGETDAALRSAAAADRLQPSPALTLEARCRIASILGHEGERHSQRHLAREAYEHFTYLDLRKLEGDERTVPLAVAEALAQSGDGETALRVLDAYHEHKELSSINIMAGDPRRLAYERLVEGQAANAAGQYKRAHDAFTYAFENFRALGYITRALQASIELAKISGQQYLYSYIARTTATFPKTFWLRRQVDAREIVIQDEILDSLSDSLRDIALLLCEGLSTPEIARRRCRSKHTIKHQISQLFKRFGVTNRRDFVTECIRRGIKRGRRATDQPLLPTVL